MKIKPNLEIPAIKVGELETTSTTKVEIEIEANLEEIKELNNHFKDVIQMFKEV